MAFMNPQSSVLSEGHVSRACEGSTTHGFRV